MTTGWTIHIFGGVGDVADRAAALLRERYRGADVRAWGGPAIDDVRDVDAGVLGTIAAVDADILCVALGNPKQERFIAANRDRLRVPVMIGVGGTPDLLVGEKRRAPRWMQRTGLEWIFRALQEPRRLGRRYARDILVFGPRAARFVFAARRLRHGEALPAPTLGEDGAPVIDLAGIDSLSMAGLGALAAERRRARQRGQPLTVRGIGPALQTQFERFGPASALGATSLDA